MNNMMTFPKTIDEFLESYQFVDRKEIYTNGSELIQVFRVQQALDHYLPKWINVKARLPEKSGTYLTARPNTFKKTYEIESLYYGQIDGSGRKKVWHYYDSEYGQVECDDVTHWMPLPSPPEGGHEDENP